MTYNDILKFWFEEIDKKNWWIKDSEFDELLRRRFLKIHESASKCELYYWRTSPHGRLAEIIILDQFSRNMFRDSPKSFSQDPLALSLSQQALEVGADQELTGSHKAFLYMPYMHSESLEIHKVALKLFDQKDIKNNLDFEIKHMKIIERFGRYPHRNKILGRESTSEEIEFLKSPGSSF